MSPTSPAQSFFRQISDFISVLGLLHHTAVENVRWKEWKSFHCWEEVRESHGEITKFGGGWRRVCERLESLVSGEVSGGLLVGPVVKRGGVSKVVQCTRLASYNTR